MIYFLISLSLIYGYLGFRLSVNWIDWLLLAVLFLSMLGFLFRKMFRWQIYLSYAAMGLLTYLTIFTVMRDLIWLGSGALFSVNYVLALTAICNIYGFINAIVGPRVKHIKVPIEDLYEELHGFTIVQISDLHIGPTIRKPYVESMVKKINATNPHIITLTGDIGDGNAARYREDTNPLRYMKARYGSFFSPGNHEYYWNANEWLTVMNNLGIINLVNRGKVIKHKNISILIAGIPDPVSGLAPDLLGVQNAESSENADYRILLSHRPGIAPEASKLGFHLQLSGHTHAGQFFPWTLVVKFVHRLSKGLHKVGDMWLYVNPGTGSWGPLLRIGTTPEITVLTLTRERNQLASK